MLLSVLFVLCPKYVAWHKGFLPSSKNFLKGFSAVCFLRAGCLPSCLWLLVAPQPCLATPGLLVGSLPCLRWLVAWSGCLWLGPPGWLPGWAASGWGLPGWLPLLPIEKAPLPLARVCCYLRYLGDVAVAIL